MTQRDTVIHNARIIRKAVRGKSKAERLETYTFIRWGALYPVKLILEYARSQQ